MAKQLTLFHPANGAVRVKDVRCGANVAAIHGRSHVPGGRGAGLGAARPHVRGAYVGFLADDAQERIHEAYPADVYARLAAVKRHYDPDNVFRLNSNILP